MCGTPGTHICIPINLAKTPTPGHLSMVIKDQNNNYFALKTGKSPHNEQVIPTKLPPILPPPPPFSGFHCYVRYTNEKLTKKDTFCIDVCHFIGKRNFGFTSTCSLPSNVPSFISQYTPVSSHFFMTNLIISARFSKSHGGTTSPFSLLQRLLFV